MVFEFIFFDIYTLLGIEMKAWRDGIGVIAAAPMIPDSPNATGYSTPPVWIPRAFSHKLKFTYFS